MSVLDRSDLEASPLADLHAIAGQLGLDGYRRLRKAELIDSILERGGGAGAREGAGVSEGPGVSAGVSEGAGGAGEEEAEAEAEPAPSARRPRLRRRRRSGEEEGTQPRERSLPRRRGRGEDEEEGEATTPPRPRREHRAATPPEEDEAVAEAPREGPRPPRPASAPAARRVPERTVEGVAELLGNGSAFLRPDESFEVGEDVYVSAAQVRRCEIASGDRVSGPMRAARGSERHPSLVRVETINGESAEAVASRPRFDSLPAAFPSERLALGSEDPTLKAIEWLTPIGLGSRVAIVGAARAGKTETLRSLLAALAGREDLQISLVLAGARPEELRDWQQAVPVEPVAAVTLAAGPDAQGQAVERAVEAAKRLAARGEHLLLAIDSLDGVPPHIARRALAAARNLVDGGSLTVIATASEPFGGESTVIALDALRTSTGRLPALDLLSSGTLKAELLVGDESAAEIVKARAEAAAASAV